MNDSRVLIGPKNTRFNEIILLKDTGSTNKDVLQAAKDGAKEGLVIAAEHQNAGRGRQERTWVDEPGKSLLISVLFQQSIYKAQFMPFVAGLAILDFLYENTGFEVSLKWPNDVLYNNSKLAGILVESYNKGSTCNLAVGMGINLLEVNDLGSTSDRAISVEALTSKVFSITQAANMLLVSLEKYTQILEQDTQLIIEKYRQKCLTLNTNVRVQVLDQIIEGKAIDVADSGALLVESSGKVHTVLSGDAHFI